MVEIEIIDPETKDAIGGVSFSIQFEEIREVSSSNNIFNNLMINNSIVNIWFCEGVIKSHSFNLQNFTLKERENKTRGASEECEYQFSLPNNAIVYVSFSNVSLIPLLSLLLLNIKRYTLQPSKRQRGSNLRINLFRYFNYIINNWLLIVINNY